MNTLFSHAIAVEPPLSEEALADIPAKRGVLLLADERDAPILLLTAADLRARLRHRLAEPADDTRRKSADLRQITRKILYTLTPSHWEADATFLELARSLFPASFAELLSWRRAWLVHVDPSEEFPHFSRTRQPGQAGLTVGPFPSGQAARGFIETIEDLFDLCRDVACLRQSPHGPACTYWQMGRCTGPCHGAISLEPYRQQVAEAAAFASGQREPFLSRLRERMRQAADATEFERAAGLKKRLDRTRTLDHEDYAHVRPMEQWRFILVQPAASKKWRDVFLAVGPAVTKIAPLSQTPTDEQLAATLAAMAAACDTAAQPSPTSTADVYRLGLIAHYLFSSPAKRGAIIHYSPDMTPQELRAFVESVGEKRLAGQQGE
ncbi:MAG: UvrB/UvrC motif-containing protein [Phycisphaerae bacterium]|nr:UvrB/UvrC motif-containing protein [Phycisphaerae bacterium]